MPALCQLNHGLRMWIIQYVNSTGRVQAIWNRGRLLDLGFNGALPRRKHGGDDEKWKRNRLQSWYMPFHANVKGAAGRTGHESWLGVRGILVMCKPCTHLAALFHVSVIYVVKYLLV